MAIIKMSIHRALSELKTYDARINKTMEIEFVVANKKSNDKIQGKTLEEYKNQVTGNLASFYALTENQRRIKSAVVHSNATTKVTIGGNLYTVAEAIERKAKLHHDEMFLSTLKTQFLIANHGVEDHNSQLPDKLEKYLQAILGEKDKRSVEDIKMHTKAFEDRNKYELIDPIDIQKQIAEVEEKLLSFKTEVDYILSESNATTFVEIDLVN